MTLADVLAARLPDKVARDVSSGTLTTYRCGGPFRVLVRADHEDDLRVLAELVDGCPVLVVGRGSNLLVADRGFDGVAIRVAGTFEELGIDGERARVEAGGAVALPVLARRCAAAGVAGLEFYVGIPGSVGGAVRMNAGGHGRETTEVLEAARVFDLTTGTASWRPHDALGFAFRRSNVGPHEIVCAATLMGTPDEPAACDARIEEIVRWRREHQPGGQNAGSVFKNPPGDAAGRIVDACGLKGLRVGGAVVSGKHANFFVADPGATAADVVALVREVQRRVEQQTGVHLEPEVQLVGFEDAPR